ncbi:MAG: transcription elongation factor Spt5, partial [Methanomicrobium sp.]|nr:transcription elongation factor Spt5 [Methanomicrobium sp.]
MTDAEEIKTTIYAMKTTAKQERTVVDNIVKALEDHDEIRVVAVMAPDELKGYVLIESPDSIARIEQLREMVPN